MKHDLSSYTAPPKVLQTTQDWFASMITYPLGKNDSIQSHKGKGYLVAEEAARYIVPSPTLLPFQRMQIYNQQYWWRLLKTLHSNFPILTRLFGYQSFNTKIGVPYLQCYPPNHWSLACLGAKLPQWIQEHYKEADQTFLMNCATLDWSFTASYIAPHYPLIEFETISPEDAENFLSEIIYLQPHVHLFQWTSDLFAFRDQLLQQEVEYWLDNPFPKMVYDQPYFFVLYRLKTNGIAWRKVNQAQWMILSLLKTGKSIEAACEEIEKQHTDIYAVIEEKLGNWLVDWTRVGWLTKNSPQEGVLYPFETTKKE